MRQRILRLVFAPWRDEARKRGEATKRFLKKKTTFVRDHFLAWRRMSTYLRGLRKETIKNWKQYPFRLLISPFEAWRDLLREKKRREADHERLLLAYHRLKRRQKLSKILKNWRHQALYGRVEGMYTRTMLLKSLSEQQLQCKAMEEFCNAQMQNVEETSKLLEEERSKVQNSELVVCLLSLFSYF